MAIPQEIDDALGDAEALWVGILSTVAPADLGAPSGCAEWTNADLINHVIGGGERYTMLLRGQSAEATAATRNNDYLSGDPVQTFWLHEHAMRRAANAADLAADVDHRAGRRPGLVLLNMRIMELSLHAHDLCIGTANPWRPGEALVTYLLNEVRPLIDELRSLGLFGPASASASDRPADEVLAMAGR
jgi:uncharacterized protein (TIGR03086 family)